MLICNTIFTDKEECLVVCTHYVTDQNYYHQKLVMTNHFGFVMIKHTNT
jgi:hypothetical protein